MDVEFVDREIVLEGAGVGDLDHLARSRLKFLGAPVEWILGLELDHVGVTARVATGLFLIAFGGATAWGRVWRERRWGPRNIRYHRWVQINIVRVVSTRGEHSASSADRGQKHELSAIQPFH